uniref:Carbohydrate ABC transporter permease n=1 Tax=Thermofilum pendens TaxID=2269 RepID=A0A7C3WKY4_THEPE
MVKVRTVLLYLIAAIVALIPLAPLGLLFALALSEHPVYVRGFTLANFEFLRTGVLFPDDPHRSKLYPNVYTAAMNTLLLALGNMALVTLVSSMAGYVISRYSFRGRSALLGTFLVIHGVPASVLLIALYYLLKTTGLLNTLLGGGSGEDGCGPPAGRLGAEGLLRRYPVGHGDRGAGRRD